MDIYSRKVVGWEVLGEESSESAADLLAKIHLKEGLRAKARVALHSDNDSPMKGATMLATMQKLGVVPSFSRPSVSNDNAFSEAFAYSDPFRSPSVRVVVTSTFTQKGGIGTFLKRHTKEQKQAILKKLALSPLSLRQFATQEGIGFSTLHGWKAQYQDFIDNSPAATNPEKWSPEEKFSVVLETTPFSEVELNEYCRAKGLYPEQVKVWKLSCIQGNMTNRDQIKQANADSKMDKKRIKELERELRRKDKALAEAAAILVLRKKLNALWDEEEEQ